MLSAANLKRGGGDGRPPIEKMRKRKKRERKREGKEERKREGGKARESEI